MTETERETGTIVITGAGGALGPDVVAALAPTGAHLVLVERDETLARIAVAGAHLRPDRYEVHAVDLLDPDATAAWATELAAAHGGEIDGLVHLVGGWRGGKPVDEAPLGDLDLLFGLLVRTLVHVAKPLLPALRASGNGRVVLVSSPQAESPTATNAAYGATKAAAEAYVLSLANDLAEHGGTANIVRVNAIVTKQMRADNPDKAYATFTDTSDIAHAIAYLLSEEASKSNGQRLVLHGQL